MKLLLAGATGLVGGAVLDAAIAADITVTAVGRRPTGRATFDLISDFSEPPELEPAQMAICALGTTIAAAGSRAAFRAVDHDAVLTFAKASRDAGVEHFAVVTAVGANPRAGVFYSRVKGDVEADLEALAFSRLDILQPGLLLGPRVERRAVESLMQRMNPLLRPLMLGPLDRYAGIDAATVGEALIALAGQHTPGVFRHENRAIQRLAKGES